MRLTNTGRKSLSLSAFQLTNNAGYTYTFPRGTKVPPRRSITVRVGTGKNTATTRYWNQKTPRLNNKGGSVSLVTWDGVQVACRAWGTGRSARACSGSWPGPASLMS